MFLLSSKYLDVVLKASIINRHHVPLITKKNVGNQWSTISAQRNPKYLSIQLNAKLNKNVGAQ